MAAVKTVLRANNNRASVRVVGTASSDTVTITLNSDLVGSGDALTAGGTPKAQLRYLHSETANRIDITRNAIIVASLYGSGTLDCAEWAITDQPTSDIVVTFVGGPGMVLLDITKTDGYSPKFESGTFGGNDDITAVGS